MEEIAVAQPEPADPSATDDRDGVDPDALATAPRKFYVGEAEVWVVAEETYYLDRSTQRLKLVEYREFVADTVRTLFPDPVNLRSRWRSRVGRHDVVETLARHGVDLGEVAERTGIPQTDPLDLLVHLAWSQPLATRRDRVRRVRREHADFFATHQPAAREVLAELLEKYAEHGIDDSTISAPCRSPRCRRSAPRQRSHAGSARPVGFTKPWSSSASCCTPHDSTDNL